MADPITGATKTQTFGQKIGSALSSGLSSSLGGLPGGLISSGLDFLSDALFAKRNYRLAEKQAQNDFNRQVQLMNLQNQQNVQNWKMQNEYNDPSAVVARLEGAGLNPALYYGGSASAATAGQIQGGSPGHGSSTVGAGAMPLNGLIGDNIERMARVANIEAQTENVRADTAKKREETETEVYEQERLQSLNQLLQSEKLGQDLKNSLLEWQVLFAEAKYNTDIHKVQEEFNLLVQNVENAKKQGQLLDKDIQAADAVVINAWAVAVTALIDTWLRAEYGQRLTEAQISQMQASAANLNASAAMTTAELTEVLQRSEYFEKHPEKIGELIELNEQAARAGIKISWFNAGVNAIGTIIGAFSPIKIGGKSGKTSRTDKYDQDGVYRGGSVTYTE